MTSNYQRIQWTGDNYQEMKQFEPSIVQAPFDYDDWPGIGILGFKLGGVMRWLKMRDTLVKSPSGRVYVLRDFDSSVLSLKEMRRNGSNN